VFGTTTSGPGLLVWVGVPQPAIGAMTSALVTVNRKTRDAWLLFLSLVMAWLSWRRAM